MFTNNKHKIRLNKPLLLYLLPFVITIGLLTIAAPGYMFFLIGLSVGGYLIFFKPGTWSTILIVSTFSFVSCSSNDYYWSAYSTSHGTKAQENYIKNQKRHKPEKRFMNSSGPTFGAQAISKKRRNN